MPFKFVNCRLVNCRTIAIPPRHGSNAGPIAAERCDNVCTTSMSLPTGGLDLASAAWLTDPATGGEYATLRDGDAVYQVRSTLTLSTGDAPTTEQFVATRPIFIPVDGGENMSKCDKCLTPVNAGFNPNTPAFMKFLCSMFINPKTFMRLYAEDPDVYTPDEDDAPSAVIANLAAQGVSTPVTISESSSEPIPRIYVVTLVRLDSGTSFADIIINFFAGDTQVGKLDGAEVSPDTDNACIRGLCLFKVCLGIEEDFTFTVRNQGSVALGAGATIRIKTHRIFPGQPGWVDCWNAFCTAAGYSEGCCPKPESEG